MLPIANAPAIVVFIFLALLILYQKIGDFLNVPRSRHTYARVMMKEDRGASMGMRKPLAYNYRVIFEIGNHQVIELTVPKKNYESVHVGSRGVLVHTNSRFRGFHIDKKIPDILKPKKKSKKSKGWR